MDMEVREIRVSNVIDRPILVDFYSTSKRNIVIKELSSGSRPLYLDLIHDKLHVILDFSDASNFQLMLFDEAGVFEGCSFAVNNHGGFISQIQAKKVLLIPYPNDIKMLKNVGSIMVS